MPCPASASASLWVGNAESIKQCRIGWHATVAVQMLQEAHAAAVGLRVYAVIDRLL